MEQEQRRIKILEKRLRLLAEYLEKFEKGEDNPTFAQFLKMRGVTRDMFIQDLPPEYANVPASGYDNVLQYAVVLQELLNGQHRIIQMEMSADGNDLQAGLIKYEGGQYIHDDCGCGCGGGCGGDDKNFSGSGGEQDGETAALRNILEDGGTEEGLNFAASGKICIKPIAPIIPEKINPGMWRSYRNKVTAYNKCVADKKSSGGHSLLDKVQHAIHLSNPMEAIGRNAFLDLVKNNVFGMASRFEQMRQFPDKSFYNKGIAKWYNFGGDPKKLDSAISIGKGKKALFKKKGWKPADGTYNTDGGAGETAGGIAAAAAIITAIVPLIQSFIKAKGENTGDQFDGSGISPDATDNTDYSGKSIDGNNTIDDGLSTMQWIGISAGIAIVLGVAGYFVFKR